MNRRPSRVVIALARWALMAGLAGIVLAGLAFIDRWRAPENQDSQHTLFVLAAILLALSFVFAPFVRRAFGVMISQPRQKDQRKTLLDEMRERPEGEAPQTTTDTTPEAPSTEQRSALTRLIMLMYLIFGTVLIVVLFVLR